MAKSRLSCRINDLLRVPTIAGASHRQRLENLGCNRALISRSLVLVLVQRLVRKVCQQCVAIDVPHNALIATLVARKAIAPNQKIGLPRPVGCDACNQTGHSGRAVAIESLVVTKEIRDMLATNRSLGEIEKAALASKVLVPYNVYPAFLMRQKLISASEAHVTVAD